jgi:hypothetical protein
MRKFLGVVASLALIAGMLYPLFEAPVVQAATTNDTAAVSLTVAATISISAPDNVSLGTITGTGVSSVGTATWTVTTNNSGGYKLEWQASSATMTSGSDTIAAYTPAVADTPETWSVASDASEWGARLKSASTDAAAEWGTDGTSEKWLNVATTPRQIVSRTTETDAAGSSEIVAFKAEIGASKFQPTGSYTVNVTVTATTL